MKRSRGWMARARRGLVLFGAAALLAGCYVGADEVSPAQPRSLAGVDVDGELTVDAAGEFVFDEGARALFDHFLAAEGEVDDEGLRARVRVEIEQRLGGDAAEQAWQGFLAYLDYRREASALAERYAGADPARVADSMLAELTAIREETIGDVPGLPDEGPRLRAALALRVAFEDPALDDQQRRDRVAALQTELGANTDPRAPSRVLSRLHAALAPIPMDDIEARRQVLVEEVGEQAAPRGLALEQRRAAAR
ncbi:MAG: lipase secretion chaperone [Nannocystaceae bacterium]